MWSLCLCEPLPFIRDVLMILNTPHTLLSAPNQVPLSTLSRMLHTLRTHQTELCLESSFLFDCIKCFCYVLVLLIMWFPSVLWDKLGRGCYLDICYSFSDLCSYTLLYSEVFELEGSRGFPVLGFPRKTCALCILCLFCILLFSVFCLYLLVYLSRLLEIHFPLLLTLNPNNITTY